MHLGAFSIWVAPKAIHASRAVPEAAAAPPG